MVRPGGRRARARGDAAPAIVLGGHNDGPLSRGPLYLTPRVILDHVGSDTNVNYSQTNPVQDTSFQLGPAVDIGLPIGERVRIRGNAELGFKFFGHESTQRYVRRSAGGIADILFGPSPSTAEARPRGRGTGSRRRSTSVSSTRPTRWRAVPPFV